MSAWRTGGSAPSEWFHQTVACIANSAVDKHVRDSWVNTTFNADRSSHLGDAFFVENATFCARSYLPTRHQMVDLPRKVTLQLLQILHLQRKVIPQHHCYYAKYGACHKKLHSNMWATLRNSSLETKSDTPTTFVYPTLLHPPLPNATLLFSSLLFSSLLFSSLLYSTLLHSTLLYSTLLYPMLLYSSLLFSSLLYCTLLYSTLLYSTLPCSTQCYFTLLFSSLLYSIVLYSTLLYSTLLYSTLLYSSLLYSTLLYPTLLYSTLLSSASSTLPWSECLNGTVCGIRFGWFQHSAPRLFCF